MKIKTRQLKVGDTMMSGEVVLRVERNENKLLVELGNIIKETKRIASWNYNGTVFVRELVQSP